MLAEIAAVVAAVGVLLVWGQLYASRRQARATFEHGFVDRYWEISDLVHAGEARPERYLRLCEDEFEAMRQGSVSWRTWDVWHAAIRAECETHRTYVDRHALTWLGQCLEVGDHVGADCPALFAMSGDGRPIEGRWPHAPALLIFRLRGWLQRFFYDRSEESAAR